MNNLLSYEQLKQDHNGLEYPALFICPFTLFLLLDKSSRWDSLCLLDVLEEVLPSGGDGGGLKQIRAYPA